MLDILKTTLLAAFLAATYGCGKCKGTDCFSPANAFTFQLVSKDNGEDLVANGTYNADSVEVYAIAGQKQHDLSRSVVGQAVYFTDEEIGREVGPMNIHYHLRLNWTDKIAFTYETKEMNRDCCTFFEMV